MTVRDKLILIGLYLSKYDVEALKELGFATFQEAFNVLGFSLGSKPSSIKNYRDEFDPLFPNNRQGWHKRLIRDYCKKFYDDFGALDFSDFTDFVKSFLIQNYDIEKISEVKEAKDYGDTVAKRLLTGKAAEEYFKEKYQQIDSFNRYSIKDTTNMACGFDYKLSFGFDYYCVEVKGLNEQKGSIQLTEKEFFVAKKLTSNYCLFIVKNFKKKPIHDIVFDPLNSQLQFKEVTREIIQTTFITSI